MQHSNCHPEYVAIVFLIIIQLTSSATNKQNASPVYEVINEQARIDDRIKVSNSPPTLPYGNPLAGNSKQNARIHASNQQAMFNAERIRQHKAQLQRWMKGPQIIDSYMKAYHDLQENHQLEVEQQQATLKDSPVTQATPRSRGRPLRQRGQIKHAQSSSDNISTVQNEATTISNRVQNQRRDLPRRGSSTQRSDPMKITKADAIVKNKRSRNHRSYGSANYHQYLEPTRYKTVYVSQIPSDITINPNGNAGLNHLQEKEQNNLYTQAIPSEETRTYSKQYGHVQRFNSVQEIEALNSLLSKNPTEQLSEFKALLENDESEEINKDVPIDFYFYLKDSAQNAPNSLDPTKYASAYMPLPVKDHIPITEEVDDIQDPNKNKLPITFASITPTKPTKLETVTKNKDHYNFEVLSQTDESSPETDKEFSLHYGYQPYYDEEDGKLLLNHNEQITGVQHLSEDGTETSAFGNDNLKYAANYEFGYRVRDQDSGNYYGHHEAKKGKSTKGQYHVLLPDGRMQQVNYSAGPSGYHADITYDHLQ